MKKSQWSFDKTIGPASLVNIVQLLAIVIFGVQFYDQVNSNQQHNEERFKTYAETTSLQNDHINKIESAQTQLLMQITTLSDHQTSQTDVIKEIRDKIDRGLDGKLKTR